MYGGEAVLEGIGGPVIGRLRSAGFGYTVRRTIGLAYLPAETGEGATLAVDVLGEHVPAFVAPGRPLRPGWHPPPRLTRPPARACEDERMPDAPDSRKSVHRRDAEGRLQVGPDWETLIERQIREAVEEGKFDDLPYQGEPLPRDEDPFAGEWGSRSGC